MLSRAINLSGRKHPRILSAAGDAYAYALPLHRSPRRLHCTRLAALVNTMLNAAIATVAASGERPVVRSHPGTHHRWPGWLNQIVDAKLAGSISCKGCSPDNAPCEGLFGPMKTELFFSHEWLSRTIEEFAMALDAYVRRYGRSTTHGSRGHSACAAPPSSSGACGLEVYALPVQLFRRPPKVPD